jgi:hypothetical protein
MTTNFGTQLSPLGNVSGLASSHVGVPERLLIDLLKYAVDSDSAHGFYLDFAFLTLASFLITRI